MSGDKFSLFNGNVNANANGIPNCVQLYTIAPPQPPVPQQQQQQQYLFQPQFFPPSQPPSNNYIIFQPLPQLFPQMPTNVSVMPSFQPVPAKPFPTTTTTNTSSSTTNYLAGQSAVLPAPATLSTGNSTTNIIISNSVSEHQRSPQQQTNSIVTTDKTTTSVASGSENASMNALTIVKEKAKQKLYLTLVGEHPQGNLAEQEKESNLDQQIKQVTTKMKQKQFTCQHLQCKGVSFSNYTQYSHHDRMLHSKILPFQCNFCKEKFKTQCWAIYHIKTKEKRKIDLRQKKPRSYYTKNKDLLKQEKSRLMKAEHNLFIGKSSETTSSKQNTETESSSSFSSSSTLSSSSSSSLSTSTSAQTTTTTNPITTTATTTTATATATATSGPHQKKLTPEKGDSKGDRQSCQNCGKHLELQTLPPNLDQPSAYLAANGDNGQQHITGTHTNEPVSKEMESPWKIVLKLKKISRFCSASASVQTGKLEGKKEREECSRRRRRGDGDLTASTDINSTSSLAAVINSQQEHFVAAAEEGTADALLLEHSAESRPARGITNDQIKPITETVEAVDSSSSSSSPLAATIAVAATADEVAERDINNNIKLLKLEYNYDGKLIEVYVSEQLINRLDEVPTSGHSFFKESLYWICPYKNCSKLTFACWNDFCLHFRQVHSGFRPYRCAYPGCTERPAHMKSSVILHFNRSHQLAGAEQVPEEMAEDLRVAVEQPAEIDREIRKLKRWWNSEKYQDMVMSRATKQIIEMEEN